MTGANTASLSIMARMIRFWVLCALLSSALGAPALAQTRAIGVEERPTGERVDECRVALVIGNGAYDTGRLRNPVNDAAAMSAALQGAGFEVTLLKDAGYQDIRRAVFSFGGALKRGGVGLFYYAGHGVQVKGANYLIPTNAQITAAEEVEVEGLNVNNVLARMASAKNRLNIVILDACRNNPYGQWYRGARSGLAQTRAPSGTYIAYATAPGQVASDGQGANSPFTEALISAMGKEGLKLEDVFKEVRGQVQTASRGDQVPWTSSSITGDFYFKPGQRGKPKIAPPVTPGASDRDALFWSSVKDSGEAEDFAEYLKQFPDGTFAGLAKRRLAVLTPAPVGKPKVASPSTPVVGTYSLRPGETFSDCPDCPEMVVVPSGNFMMGSPESEEGRDDDEGPRHRVTISVSFAVGKFEVTRRQFARFIAASGHRVLSGCHVFDGAAWSMDSSKGWRDPGFAQGDDHPVACVSWGDAQAYVRWLSGQTGQVHRLLTEAEWEYIARAGTRTYRYWGADRTDSEVCQFANGADRSSSFEWRNMSCSDGVGAGTSSVGRFKANDFGLFDGELYTVVPK